MAAPKPKHSTLPRRPTSVAAVAAVGSVVATGPSRPILPSTTPSTSTHSSSTMSKAAKRRQRLANTKNRLCDSKHASQQPKEEKETIGPYTIEWYRKQCEVWEQHRLSSLAAGRIDAADHASYNGAVVAQLELMLRYPSVWKCASRTTTSIDPEDVVDVFLQDTNMRSYIGSAESLEEYKYSCPVKIQVDTLGTWVELDNPVLVKYVGNFDNEFDMSENEQSLEALRKLTAKQRGDRDFSSRCKIIATQSPAIRPYAVQVSFYKTRELYEKHLNAIPLVQKVADIYATRFAQYELLEYRRVQMDNETERRLVASIPEEEQKHAICSIEMTTKKLKEWKFDADSSRNRAVRSWKAWLFRMDLYLHGYDSEAAMEDVDMGIFFGINDMKADATVSSISIAKYKTGKRTIDNVLVRPAKRQDGFTIEYWICAPDASRRKVLSASAEFIRLDNSRFIEALSHARTKQEFLEAALVLFDLGYFVGSYNESLFD